MKVSTSYTVFTQISCKHSEAICVFAIVHLCVY